MTTLNKVIVRSQLWWDSSKGMMPLLIRRLWAKVDFPPAFLRRYDQNGRDCMPASFLHASRQAPNCIYRQERPFVRARVAFLIGSKFEPHSLKSNLQDKVDCRAYYPVDAWSSSRDHAFLDNIWGTSCYKAQLNAEFAAELYNVTNRYVDTGVSANYCYSCIYFSWWILDLILNTKHFTKHDSWITH